MVELQSETMDAMTFQMLDAVVAILDRGEIPTFFYIESGGSNWGGNYNASLSAVVGLPFRADNTSFTGSGGGGESVGLSWEINDFGPASMTRVTAIYEYLCYPIHIGNGQLPNGALYYDC
jgi:hypothetical protein